MIKANFHTHSTFSDGANTPEEMVQAAISLGMTALGFSDHSPISAEYTGTTGMAFEDETAYRQEILRLKEAYADRLPIYLGIEQDSNSPRTPYPYDYTIGSIHGIWTEGQYRAVDCSEETMLATVRDFFGGDHYAYAESYFRAVAETAGKFDPTFFGHIDLVAKYNEGGKHFDESHPRYRKAALEAVEALISTGKPFEINTGAITRGYRTVPYPAAPIREYIRQQGGRFILSSDSHRADTLCFGFDRFEEFTKSS